MTLTHITKTHIITALQQTGGNQSAAAIKLGVDRKTVNQWVRKDPELMEALTEIVDTNLDLAEGQAFKLILAGDREMIKFYLRCFGKKRGWIENSNADEDSGRPIITITLLPEDAEL